MPTDSRRQVLKTIKLRKFLNRDFDSLRSDLLEYARTYYPDQIRDFSEAGIGGLLLDLAAYVGDVQSYYLDHQFHENFADTAVELNNIERHLNRAGVPIVGSSPAVVNGTIFIKVPAVGNNPPIPDTNSLPVIRQGSAATAQNGVEFELTDDIDFTEVDGAGSLKAKIEIGSRDINNNPTNFILSREEIFISGLRSTETFSVSGFEPFKKFVLGNENVTEIVRVFDSLGNEYYQVDYLTQDVVYKINPNNNPDSQDVESVLTPIPAPYRFIKETSLATRLTTLTFGGASADTINDDIIPDPSEFAIPLYGKQTLTRFTLNPGNLLQTTTFGVLSPNTTITVIYRYGGGLEHNIEPQSLRTITRLDMSFPNSPSAANSQFVRNSVDVVNFQRAAGGDNPPTVDELKNKIPQFRSAQSRIVSKPDLLARIYTMPSNFGRVFRASVQPNPNNPLAARLFIICRDQQNRLIVAPDSLKKNLASYLNQYRMISDALDILDARVINFKVQFTIVADPTLNRQLVLKNVLQKLKSYFDISNYNIDQPIVLADVQNIIYNNNGVVSVVSLDIQNIYGSAGSTDNPRVYSNEQFDIKANTSRGIIFPQAGTIFEIRYKDNDIIGAVL